MYDEDQYDAFSKEMEMRYPEMFQNPYGAFCLGLS